MRWFCEVPEQAGRAGPRTCGPARLLGRAHEGPPSLRNHERPRGIPAESADVKEIVDISNVVMPCLLLELGRRKRHIAAEFPRDPCEPEAHFGLGVAVSAPLHSVTSEQIKRLVTDFGEDLVGLCYFGDQQSREVIETELKHAEAEPNRKAGSCRSLASSSPKPKH